MLNENQFPGYSVAKAAMYESMPDNQLKAIHTQSKFIMEHGKSDNKSKHEDRLKYTTPLMEQRKLSEAPPKSQKGVNDGKTKYGTPSTPGASHSAKPNPNIRYR